MTSMERARKLIDDCRDDADPYNGPDGETIAAAIDAAVAEERERCQKAVRDAHAGHNSWEWCDCKDIAAAIRKG